MMRSGRRERSANEEFKRSYATSVAVGLMVAVTLHLAAFALLPSV